MTALTWRHVSASRRNAIQNPYLEGRRRIGPKASETVDQRLTTIQEVWICGINISDVLQVVKSLLTMLAIAGADIRVCRACKIFLSGEEVLVRLTCVAYHRRHVLVKQLDEFVELFLSNCFARIWVTCRREVASTRGFGCNAEDCKKGVSEDAEEAHGEGAC